MKSVFARDKKKRIVINNFENTNLILKNLSKNKRLKNSIRLNATLVLFNFLTNSFKSRSTERCIVTFRNSKIHKNFRFSRIFFFKDK